MGIRYYRSIGLGKLLRLNISKSGIGVSARLAGVSLSAGPSGSFINLNLPGTGLSYRKRLGSGTAKQAVAEARSGESSPPSDKPAPLPSPGFFAPRHEKELAKGLEAYRTNRKEEALTHFLEAAPEEPGAAIFAAALLAEKDPSSFQATEMLEKVVQSDGEFPTPLMEKYMSDASLNVNITPRVTVTVPVGGLAATLLLVELYQREGRFRNAIGLLEEIEELATEPVLTLSLCELYAERSLWEGIIDKAKNTEPEDDVTLELLIYYGRAMQEMDMQEAAVTVFTKALRRKKNRESDLINEAMYWRAISYIKQGKVSQANKEFQRIFAENPDFRDVAQRLNDAALR
jgi:tetratricopeptide (TPR) repeat protein